MTSDIPLDGMEIERRMLVVRRHSEMVISSLMSAKKDSTKRVYGAT